MLAAGCSSSSHSDRKVSPGPSVSQLDVDKVVEIAKRAVAENDTWADRATYKTKQKDDGTWLVIVWRIMGYDANGKPQFTPGGHRFIDIDPMGKVTNYGRGR